MDVSVIIKIMTELFIMMMIGYVLYKTGILDKNTNEKITKLILYVTMPALIVDSVLEQSQKPSENIVLMTFVVSTVMYIVLPVIGIAMAKLIRADKKQQGLYAFMLTYSNIGYMGFPVIASLFGSTAVFYTAIVNILFSITSFSIGVVLLKYGGSTNAEFDVKKLLKPGVLFSAFAIVIYALDLKFPVVVSDTFNSLGKVTTPLAMMLMGSTLASMSIRQIFGEIKIYVFCFIKQAVLPVCLYPVVKFFISDALLFGVVMVLLMMPVGTNAVMFSIEYEGDEKLAAKSVFVSTVLSMITIPALIYFLRI